MKDILNIDQNGEDVFGLAQYFLAAIEERLKEEIEQLDVAEPISSAINYMLFPGGKRIRPLLTLLLCYDLGGVPQKILPGAVALEIVHTASLIHDDLPAMDNDDSRRGKPTCHKMFGEAVALLTGDYMFSLAIELAGKVEADSDSKLMVTTRINRAFSVLCNGQQLDLNPSSISEAVLVHEQKTGALFGAAAFIAGIGLLSSSEMERLARFGVNVGEYFQLLDDRADLNYETEKGKGGSNLFAIDADFARRRLEDLEAVIAASYEDLEGLAKKGATDFKGVRYLLNLVRAAF